MSETHKSGTIFLSDVVRRLKERCVSEDEAGATPEESDAEYPGTLGHTASEKTFLRRRLVVKMLCNRGSEGERVVMTVERGKAEKQTPVRLEFGHEFETFYTHVR